MRAAFLTFLLALLLPAAAGGAVAFDPSFGSGGIATPALPPEAAEKAASIVDLAAAPDGTTVGALGGVTRSGYFGAVRLTPAGAPDPAFGQDGFVSPPSIGSEGATREVQAEAVAVQPDGQIVLAGYAQQSASLPTSFTSVLARYLPDGSLDPEFGTGGVVAERNPSRWEETQFHAVDVAADGRIVAVGEHVRSIPRSAGIVAAFKADGSVDKSFGRRGLVVFTQRAREAYSSLSDVEVLDSGKILVVGYHDYRLVLARLRSNGRPDRGFGGGDGRITLDVHQGNVCCPPASLAVQADGRIVVVTQGERSRTLLPYLIRFRPAGGLDRSFGHRGIAAPKRPWRLFRPYDVAVQPDGGIVTVGQSAKTARNAVAGAYSVFRNLPDGSPDESFGEHGLKMIQMGDEGFAGAALAQADGSVLTGGSFATRDDSTNRSTTTLLLARFRGN
ncbi:MAG TPA: delta-60 repeat domain-containing protein [Solirubrobacterales bacterium]|nr:delta-60 repeat domain-containing protein [Solirubrobacterales bacterium]